MKRCALLLIALLVAVAAQAQPIPQRQPLMPPNAPPGMPPGAPPAVAAPDPVNYLIRIEWKEPKSDPKYLEVLTTEGHFNLDTIQKTSVKINNNEVPVTLKFDGTLNVLGNDKGRLQLFLGRTVPYVTGSVGFGPGASSYSQLSVGLNSTFIVTFGKSIVIQNDENGEISVLVKRMKD